MRRVILAFLIMFQSVPMRADITNSVSTIINQLRESLVISDLFKDKQLLAAIAFFSVCVGYSWYIKNRGSKKKTAPSLNTTAPSLSTSEDGSSLNDSIPAQDDSVLKAVTEVEKILKLKEISVTGSYGFMGPELYKRVEAITRVLDANRGICHLTLEQNQSERMNILLQNPQVKAGLISNQEEHLRNELEMAKEIWILDTYGDIACKKLNLKPLESKERNPSIGHSSGVPKKQDAYNKLNVKERSEIAFETFSRDTISYNIPRLTFWQENSVLFKEPLKQILDDLTAKKK